jgi:hypothetical protein
MVVVRGSQNHETLPGGLKHRRGSGPAGLHAVSVDEPGWIIVKGVSDFAEAGSRIKEELDKNREQAARNAARAALRALAMDPMST